jgi:hypothetical protein
MRWRSGDRRHATANCRDHDLPATTRTKEKNVMKNSLPNIALVSALCLTVTGTAFADTSVPQVHLQAQMGTTPVAAESTTFVTGPQTEYVLVTLAPPARGLVEVMFASPGMNWRQNRDGSWNAWLRVPAETDDWTILVDVASATERDSGLIKLTMTTTSITDGLVITVAPQAGWVKDMISDLLSPDFCAAYLDAYQFPSHSPSPTVWQYCVDLLL